VKSKRKLPAVGFGDSDVSRVGDWVVAIGNPFGLGGTVTAGIISARGRDINSGPYDDFIQTDASINRGNSGGPMFNLEGEVIGINTAIFSPSGGSVGIGFAIPVNMARKITEQLAAYGSVKRGQLGVMIQDLTPDLAEAFGLDVSGGAVIANILPSSSADRAGLERGDVIVAVNSAPIRGAAQLRNKIGLLRLGETVELEVIRKGKTRSITAKIGARVSG
jgi:serine protease Do